MLSSLTSVKVTVAAALSGLVLTGGVGAAAAAGSLPGAAQDTASEWLGKVGVTVPGADDHAAGHADERGSSTDAADDDEGTTEHTSQGKGAAVSELAKSDLEGKDKGAAVSEYASNTQSRAGDEHGAGEHGAKADHTKQEGPEKPEQADAATTKAPVHAPKTGGSDAEDDVKSEKDDSATASTDQTDETSEGHSAAVSESRP